MIIKKWMFFCFVFVVFHTVKARVSEMAIEVLPTGQIVIPVQFPGVEKMQYVLLVANGKNQLRGDINKKLMSLEVDTTASKVLFENFKVGSFSFKEPILFRISKNLNQQSDLAFTDSIVGTLSLSLFRSTALQMSLPAKKLIIADSFEELNFTENLKVIVFSSSYVNNVPVVKVRTALYGEQSLYIDPTKPVAFHFLWNSVSEEVKKTNQDKLMEKELSLNGKDKIKVLQDKAMDIYLESDARVKSQVPSFSDAIAPCIGQDFLKEYVFTIDFRNATMYLDPISDKGKQELIEME